MDLKLVYCSHYFVCNFQSPENNVLGGWFQKNWVELELLHCQVFVGLSLNIQMVEMVSVNFQDVSDWYI